MKQSNTLATKHYLYKTYENMKSRCYNKNASGFKNYGGRGITICDRWLELDSKGFWNFVEDMGPRPEGYQLDRIDVNGSYCPENCRWVTFQQNQTNTRIRCNNKSGYRGVFYKTDKVNKKWQATIKINNKRIFLGYYKTKEEAADAYDNKALELHGEFAGLNFPERK